MAAKKSEDGTETTETTEAEAVVDATTDVAQVWEPTRYASSQASRPAPRLARANENLYAHGDRAAVVGDLVPLATVERHGWQTKVTPL